MCLENIPRSPLILSLRSLIFLNQQLTRFLYDRYQGVQLFQRIHRVSDQLFNRYFCTTLETKHIAGFYTCFHFFAYICKFKTMFGQCFDQYIVTFFMISCHTILTEPISYCQETFFNMVSLILFPY